eukprot:2092256-Alexandrium_andersonii.AAC.1
MQDCHRRSQPELRGPENDLEFHPGRPRPGSSASSCAPRPVVTTNVAGGRALSLIHISEPTRLALI